VLEFRYQYAGEEHHRISSAMVMLAVASVTQARPSVSAKVAPDAGYMLFGLLVFPKQDFHLQAPAVFSGHALSKLGVQKRNLAVYDQIILDGDRI